jgi:DNA-binding MarR family transcriptional regulator
MTQRASKADQVLQALTELGRGAHTAGEVVNAAELPNSTVTDNLRKLVLHGKVERKTGYEDGRIRWELVHTDADLARESLQEVLAERAADNADTIETTRRLAETHADTVMENRGGADATDEDLVAEVAALSLAADVAAETLDKLKMRRTFLRDQAEANEPDQRNAKDDPLPTRREFHVSELAGQGLKTTGSPAVEVRPGDVALVTGVTPTGQRKRGVLENSILAWYANQETGHEAGPYEVAKGIGAVTGSVHPAMERLVAKGELRKTRTDRPVRYAL